VVSVVAGVQDGLGEQVADVGDGGVGEEVRAQPVGPCRSGRCRGAAGGTLVWVSGSAAEVATTRQAVGGQPVADLGLQRSARGFDRVLRLAWIAKQPNSGSGSTLTPSLNSAANVA